MIRDSGMLVSMDRLERCKTAAPKPNMWRVRRMRLCVFTGRMRTCCQLLPVTSARQIRWPRSRPKKKLHSSWRKPGKRCQLFLLVVMTLENIHNPVPLACEPKCVAVFFTLGTYSRLDSKTDPICGENNNTPDVQ